MNFYWRNRRYSLKLISDVMRNMMRGVERISHLKLVEILKSKFFYSADDGKLICGTILAIKSIECV